MCETKTTPCSTNFAANFLLFPGVKNVENQLTFDDVTANKTSKHGRFWNIVQNTVAAN